MSAFALDENHDIFLTGGQIAIATGADFVVQKIETQLLMYLGEWWLDITAGVPWFQKILVSPADIENAESILRRLIIGTAGVVELKEFDATFNNKTREFVVTFLVLTEFGPSDSVEVSVSA